MESQLESKPDIPYNRSIEAENVFIEKYGNCKVTSDKLFLIYDFFSIKNTNKYFFLKYLRKLNKDTFKPHSLRVNDVVPKTAFPKFNLKRHYFIKSNETTREEILYTWLREGFVSYKMFIELFNIYCFKEFVPYDRYSREKNLSEVELTRICLALFEMVDEVS
jgi:hypothetical protein